MYQTNITNNSIKLSHRFKSLSFGDTTQRVVKRFELDPHLFFRRFDDINTFKDNQILNYNYFIKIIPYMLIDENWGSTYYAYSFSLTSKSTPFNVGILVTPSSSIISQ